MNNNAINYNVNNNLKKDSLWVRIVLISIAMLFFLVILVIPLISIFYKAFEQGLKVFIDSVNDPMALKAIGLTVITILIVVPVNTVFGVLIAWAVTKYKFKGKNLLLTVIDLPFCISPVVAGLMFVLIFSNNYGVLAPILNSLNLRIIFSPPAIIIVTLFVTVPFVARELIPIMEAQGTCEEEAAITLGAGGFRTFWLVTLPNIKWALYYGVMLSVARAAGEFGAVSVVSGHIRGLTNTIPLHVEILYNEYKFQAAFAVASLLTVISIINLVIKNISDFKIKQLKIKMKEASTNEH